MRNDFLLNRKCLFVLHIQRMRHEKNVSESCLKDIFSEHAE